MDDLIFFKTRAVDLETENSQLKQEIISLKQTTSTPPVKESGRGWMSDESDEEEEEEEVIKKPGSFIDVNLHSIMPKRFSEEDNFEGVKWIAELDMAGASQIASVKIPEPVIESNIESDKIDDFIQQRKEHYFPGGDENLIKIKVTDSVYGGNIVLIRCPNKDALQVYSNTGILLNNDFEKYGYYREWLDDKIDEFKNDEEVVLDPYTNGELTEYIIEGSRHGFLNGSYTEYQYSEITGAIKEGNRNVEYIYHTHR
jgi:hypothetical protein